MSNVLHPLASRYSLFFTVALFDSSRVCQSRHTTKTVQDIVLEAQERYERLDRKQARHKLRALLRNVSMASASSDSTGTSSSTQRTTITEDSGSTELSCNTSSSSWFDTTVKAPTPEHLSVDPSLAMPSFPPVLATANADISAISSRSKRDTALADSSNNPTTETTTVSSPSSPSSSDNCRQQFQPHVSVEAVTHSSSLSSSSSKKLARAIKRKVKQLQHNNRTSIATLLSIALTTLFLSMLQRRRHRLTVLARKGPLLLPTPSRQSQQSLNQEKKSFNGAQEHTHQEQQGQQEEQQDRHDPQLRQLSHHHCEASPRRDHPGRLRLYRRGTLVSSASSSSFFSFSSPLSSTPAHLHLSSSSSLHQILPSSFNMITAATATSPTSIPHHTRSTKEAYVSAWLQQQNLHDRAAWNNRAEPNHSSYSLSSVHPSNNPTNLRHRRSISLMSSSELEDEIHQSEPELQLNQQQQHHPQSSQTQKRHSSTPTHYGGKGHGSCFAHLSSLAAANMTSTHATTTTTTIKSKKHRRHKSMHESCSRSPEELAWDSHYYYQRQQRERQVYMEEQHRLARLRGTTVSVITPGMVPTRGLCRHSSHPVNASYISSFSTESIESAVARAKSLNRLAAPALLSRETSKALGICRSDTLSTNGKNRTQEKDSPNSRSASPPPLQMSRDRARTMNFNSWDQYRGAPSTPPTLAPLKRKKTLKEHLTPSFRSFASRFGSGGSCNGGASGNSSSSRPSSFAGSKGDLLSFENGSSRSATPTPGLNRHSISGGGGGGGGGHLLDFKPLKAGPETAEHLRRCSLEQQQRPASTDGGSSGAGFERRTTIKLAHRRGASFSCSASPLEGDGRVFDHGGVDHGSHGNGYHNNSNNDDDDEDEDEHEDHQENVQGEPEEFAEGVFSFEESPPVTQNGNTGNNDSMKKQILTLLSIRRKSKSSLKSNSTSTTMMAASPMCLSPLELEAQEDLPWGEDDEDDDDDDDDDDDRDEEVEEEELCGLDHGQETAYSFDFMLVPKAQYEFQPLVM